MDISAHKRTLGIVHIVYGAITALLFVFAGAIIAAFGPFIAEAIIEEEGRQAEAILEMVGGIIRMVFLLALIFTALPSIIAGIAIIQKKEWGMIIALIAGCISIFSFPFGTALGVYTLYVFIENNKSKNDQNKE